VGRALPRLDPHGRVDGRHARAPQPRAAAGDPLPRAHGAGRADARDDARERQRQLPRFGLAARADPAPARRSPRASRRAT
jgi:hypothetical protein